MYVIKDQLDHFEEKFAKVIQIFLSKKVRSGSDTIIPKAYRILKTATGFSPGINKQSHVLVKFRFIVERLAFALFSAKNLNFRSRSKSPELELLLISTGCLTPFSGEKILVCVVCTQERGVESRL
jgi:hypothetical protein